MGPQEIATFVEVLRRALSTIASEGVTVRDVRPLGTIRIESRIARNWLIRERTSCDILAKHELGGLVVRVSRYVGFSMWRYGLVLSGVWLAVTYAVCHAAALVESRLSIEDARAAAVIVPMFVMGSFCLWQTTLLISGGSYRDLCDRSANIFRDAVIAQVNQSMVEMRIPESIIQRSGEALKKND